MIEGVNRQSCIFSPFLFDQMYIKILPRIFDSMIEQAVLPNSFYQKTKNFGAYIKFAWFLDELSCTKFKPQPLKASFHARHKIKARA